MKIKLQASVEISEADAQHLDAEFKKTTFYGDNTVPFEKKLSYYIITNGVKDMNNLIYDLKYLDNCRTKKGAYRL